MEIQLETKVRAFCNGTICGDYTTKIKKSTEGRWLFIVVPCKGTAGQWSWYLSTLLEKEPLNDVIYLDYGAGWYVVNMKEALFEAIKHI